MRTGNLISREDAVREALGLYRDAQQSVRKCWEAEDDFGFLAFSGQKEAFRWMAMVLMALPEAGEDAHAKEPNEPLTIQQLRKMDGKPVWLEEVEHWALIDIEKGGQWDGIPFAVWAENGANFTYNIEGRELHCFRRPPEGEGNA